MNLSVSLRNGTIEFLNSILESEKLTNKSAMKKMQRIFTVVTPIRKAYKTLGKAAFDANAEMTDIEQRDKTMKKEMVVPESKMEEYNKQMDAIADTKSEITLDRETFSFMRSVVNNVFSRPQLKDGLNGADQVEAYTTLSAAIDEAAGVTDDEEPFDAADVDNDRQDTATSVDGVAKN